jgi:hypothetical protein
LAIRERLIEQYLIKQVHACGGEIFKWISPNHRGVPDRIVFILGQIWFVETKTTKGKLSVLQVLTQKLIMRHTTNYIVITSKKEVDDFIERLYGL